MVYVEGLTPGKSDDYTPKQFQRIKLFTVLKLISFGVIMKTLYHFLYLVIFCFAQSSLLAQIITGKVVNQNENSLTGLNKDLYISSSVYLCTSGNNGTFSLLTPLSNGNLESGNLYVNTKTTGNPCYGTPTVTYEGKTYNTVQIGDQCWLKENLDVGTRINGSNEQINNGTIEKYCYGDNPNNCTAYGGLYQWNEAMQYSTTEGVRGICPDGWHIPTYSEIQTLRASVNFDGDALKEIGKGTRSGIGTNKSGFSTLLAGACFNGGFGVLGSYDHFWSSTEGSTTNSIIMYLGSNDSGVGFYNYQKEYGFSIRCVKDNINVETLPQKPNLLFPSNNSTDISLSPTTITWNESHGAASYTLQVSTSSSFPDFVYNKSSLINTGRQINDLEKNTKYYWRVNAVSNSGTSDWSEVWNFTTASSSSSGNPCSGILIVSYEGKTYNTVQIGSQCWLKENLDVGTSISGISEPKDNGTIEKYCFDDKPENCTAYGAFYQWNEAMQYSTKEGARGICPEGWHIPTYSELQTLRASINFDGDALKEIGIGLGSGVGTNKSSFSALLPGNRDVGGAYYNINWDAPFWSSSEYNTNSAFYMFLGGNDSRVGFYDHGKKDGYSVRCVKD